MAAWKYKLNFSHSALFHMKTRVFLKFFVRACRTQKSSNCCIKAFRNSPRGGGNSVKVWVKTASSEAKYCFLRLLDLHVLLWFCEISVFCLSGFLSTWLSTASSKIHIFYYFFFDFLQWQEIYKNQGPYLLKKA